MKKYVLRTLMFSITISFNSVSLAQSGWTNSTRIFDLRVFNGVQILGQASDTEVSGGCANAASLTNFQRTTFVLDTESPLYQETYSILLTAQASGRNVQVYRTGNCLNNNLAIINGARLRNVNTN